MCFQRVFESIKKTVIYKKNFVCKEKSGTVKKARKLRSIISFILEICYKHHVVNVEITHKIRTFFKTLASKNVAKSRLKKSQSNDKLSRKAMFFSYHREWKTFIEASWRKYCLQLPLLNVCGSFLFRQSKKTRGILWSVWVFFAFLEVKRRNKYCLWEANLVFYM